MAFWFSLMGYVHHMPGGRVVYCHLAAASRQTMLPAVLI